MNLERQFIATFIFATEICNKVYEVVSKTHLCFLKMNNSLTGFPYLGISIALLASILTIFMSSSSELARASHPTGTQTDKTLTGVSAI